MDYPTKDFPKKSSNIGFLKALKLFLRSWRSGELEYIFSDELTLLPNRKKFLNDYHSFVGRANRHDICSALIFIDLDNLKKVNDEFDHAHGDFLISSFSEAVRDSLREYDLPARWGGDEFIILVEGFKKESEANELLVKNVIDRIQNKWKNIITRSDRFHKILNIANFSYGYSYIKGDDIMEAIDEADRNMYRQKNLKNTGRK